MPVLDQIGREPGEEEGVRRCPAELADIEAPELPPAKNDGQIGPERTDLTRALALFDAVGEVRNTTAGGDVFDFSRIHPLHVARFAVQQEEEHGPDYADRAGH